MANLITEVSGESLKAGDIVEVVKVGKEDAFASMSHHIIGTVWIVDQDNVANGRVIAPVGAVDSDWEYNYFYDVVLKKLY